MEAAMAADPDHDTSGVTPRRPEDAPLAEDVRRLGALLGETINALDGAEVFAAVEAASGADASPARGRGRVGAGIAS